MALHVTGRKEEIWLWLCLWLSPESQYFVLKETSILLRNSSQLALKRELERCHSIHCVAVFITI
jgi:hypothetical protein